MSQLFDQLKQTSPSLVDSLLPDVLPISAILKVLKNLLAERVPIRDLRTISESLAEAVTRSKDTEILTTQVRISLSRLIVDSVIGGEQELPVITLDPQLEQILLQSVMQAKQSGASELDASIEPSLTEKLQQSMMQAVEKQEIKGVTPILLTASSIRRWLAVFARQMTNQTVVLAYNEVPAGKKITIVASIGS